MGEIVFLFGGLFGIAIGRMFNKIDKVRMDHFEAEMVRAQRRARHYRSLYHAECKRNGRG